MAPVTEDDFSDEEASDTWPEPQPEATQPLHPANDIFSELVCPRCGNVYAADSRYCRKCDHKRGS